MKIFNKPVGIILAVLLVSGCYSIRSKFSRYAYQKPSKYELPENLDTIKLDGSYKLYTRKEYIDTNYKGEHVVINQDSVEKNVKKTKSYKDSITNKNYLSEGERSKTSKQYISDQTSPKLAEIEYLFVSPKNILYISTTPDPNQMKYNSLTADRDSFPNAATFREFLFGQVEPDRFIFRGKDRAQGETWLTEKKGDTIILNNIAKNRLSAFEDDFPIGSLFPEPIKFIPVAKSWQIIYLKPGEKKYTAEDHLQSNLLLVSKQSGKHKDSYKLILPFVKDTILYDDKYIIYSPDAFFHH